MVLSFCRSGMAIAPLLLCSLGLLATLSQAQDKQTTAGKQMFPSPAGTYKYRIKADITELATDGNGDLSPEYPAVKKKMDLLIEDASRFDLTKTRELGDYAKYVGKELGLPKGKQVGFNVKTDSGNEVFVGKLRVGKSGEYELAPSIKGK
ncbi:MAG: hypothetical protein U0840_16715 [Gemmataceae bacterium]